MTTSSKSGPRLLAAILFASPLLCAQALTGVGPGKVRDWQPVASLSAQNLGVEVVEGHDFTAAEPAEKITVVSNVRRLRTSPPSIQTLELDPKTDQVKATSIIAAVVKDGDTDGRLSHNGKHFFFRRGSEIHHAQRSDTKAPFLQSSPITGLSGFWFAPAPYVTPNNRLGLAVCGNPPDATIAFHEFDPQLNKVQAAYRTYRLPFGNPKGDYHASCLPFRDPLTGQARAWTIQERAAGNFGERLHFLDEGASTSHVFYTCKDNLLGTLGTWGGRVFAPAFQVGPNPGLKSGVHALDLAITNGGGVPHSTGGKVSIAVFGSPEFSARQGYAVVFAGLLGKQPVATPFGPFGLDLTNFLALAGMPVSSATGFGSTEVQLPIFSEPITFGMQALYADGQVKTVKTTNTSYLALIIK